MTREEALEFIAQSVKSDVDMALIADALKALEQQPCEDAISREQAIKQCGFGMTSLHIADNLRRLPSVTPQLKTGHWIKENILTCKCSICGKEAIIANWQCILSDYCPYCGAKMIEPQESEG